MIQQETHNPASRMLVLSNSTNNFHTLSALLGKYFPPNEAGLLQLKTKYYTASVQVVHCPWPARGEVVGSVQEEQAVASPEDKQDLLVMLAGEEESFSPQLYDFVIAKYDPENFLLVLNTRDREKVWSDEEIIASQVNNFIQVIKEDLKALLENPPERMKTGLLAEYQEGTILSLVDLMETTQWSNMKRVAQTSNKNNHKPTKEETETTPISKQQQKPEQPKLQSSLEKQPQQQKKQEVSAEPQQQISDQLLQQQMMGFESMLRQMMTVKTMAQQPQGIPDGQRKRKAEDLLGRLMGANFL